MSVSFYASLQEADDPNKTYIEDLPGPNWSNDNAKAMLCLLNLYFTTHLDGSASIHDALRATIKTRSTIDRLVHHFVREGIMEKNYIDPGLDESGIRRRLELFWNFLMAAQQRGAKSIYWA
jgi:hypothetical protein